MNYETFLMLTIPKGVDFAPFVTDCGFRLNDDIYEDDTHTYQTISYSSELLDYPSHLIIIHAMQKSLRELNIISETVESLNKEISDIINNSAPWPKIVCTKPTPLDVAIHRATSPATSGIEPLYQPLYKRFILHKNRYSDEKE